MIEGNTVGRHRALFVLLLAASFLVPLLVFIPYGYVLRAFALPVAAEVALVLLALAMPLPVLYFAARAGARAQLPHGAGSVFLAWWLLSIAAAFTNAWTGHLSDHVLRAFSLGVVSADTGGFIVTPSWLQSLGVSDSIVFGIPNVYMLFLLGSYVVIRRKMTGRSSGNPGEESTASRLDTPPLEQPASH